jgi:hypothetical protein
VIREHFRPAVSIDDLEPSSTNPRKTFDAQRLAELAKTIGEKARDRRRRAPLARRQARQARDRPRHRPAADDKQALEIQTIENAQREDLHPLEQADGYERLIKEFGYTPEKIADAIGKSRAHVFQIRKLRASRRSCARPSSAARWIRRSRPYSRASRTPHAGKGLARAQAASIRRL